MPSSFVRALLPAAALLAASATLAAQGTPASSVRVGVADGFLAGRDSAGVRVFRGVPYAAPPVGALRWRPPQPVDRWQGARDATAFGAVCPQTDRLVRSYGGVMDPTSEDCLTLNVWTAASDSTARRPVMVWIHGGAFTHGSGRTAIYDGTRLALDGVVVVTLNYRLGPLGFLAHPALSAESPQHASGNYAFLDQVAALQWVRRNIAAFGGDVNRVTIFGESAGAFSVGYHLVSPLSRGLFQRAIMQSGSGMRDVVPLRAASDTAPSAERTGVDFARSLGIDGGPDAAARLRNVSVDSIVRASAEAGAQRIGETVDGVFLTEPPMVSFARGRHARVAVIVGTNANESTILVRQLPVATADQFEALVRKTYGGAAAALLTLYPSDGATGTARAYRDLWTDAVFAAPARRTARAFSISGLPVWRYAYTRVGGGMTGLAIGAFHASEIPFVFGALSVKSPLWGTTPYDSALSDAMRGYWVQFATTGDPNGGGRPAWPRFDAGADGAIEFGPEVRATQGLRRAQLDVLEEVLRVRTEQLERGSPARARATGGARAGEQLVVLNKSDASAALIDLATGATVATMPVGLGPHEVAVSPDRRTAVVCNYGTGPAPGSSLTVLDLVGRRVVRTIDLGVYRRPHGVEWLADGRRIVVTSEASQNVLVIDVATWAVERAIPTGLAGSHLLVVSRDGRRGWVSNIGAGSVSLVDFGTGTVVKSAAAGRRPEAIDVSPNGKEVWSADGQLNRVTIFDATTMDTLASMPTGDNPNRLKFTPDGRLVLVSNARSGTLGIFDVARRVQVGEIRFPVDSAAARPPSPGAGTPGSATPLGIVMHPSGATAWVALAAIDRIAEVDISTRTVVRLLQTGREPDGMAFVRAATAGAYFPPPGAAWERRPARAVGMDSAGVADAVAYARAHEINWARDMKTQLATNTAKEPFPSIDGPFQDRGVQSGVIIRHGYIVAEWGDTGRVDMTFSVAKSYLATVIGWAYDHGKIPDVDQPVRALVHDGGFDSPHDAPITWRHLLTQTSEWEGTLWNKPDVADRRAGYDRVLREPGTFWEYNDVRVNRTSLAALRVIGEPLPVVLKREIMDPIGASSSWVWHGYANSYVDIGGQRVQSVSGGGHWGGGVWATTRDHARFGYLMLRRGQWGNRQLLSEQWVDLATTPTAIKPVYGFFWWLNTDRQQYPAATARSFFALGAGGNIIWMAPDLDLVVVLRWIDVSQVNEFMRRVVAATPAG